ncbi:MAG: thiamine pyrophosphate-binding protein [Pseudomonadota bacterium]
MPSFQKDSKTGAQIIADRLKAAGCAHAFGIPGGEVLALLEALDGAGIAFHLTKHENAAGFMAEGVWHAEPTGSRALGLLIATLGPGVANAVNVVANAMQDRVPMLFLTGCIDAAEAETYTHQVFDHQAMLRPIVKGSFKAATGAVGPMIEKALALAFDGQPGPVHIDLPISVAEQISAEPTLRPAPVPAPTVPAASNPLGEAITALNMASRPIILAGLDAVNEGASSALIDFAQQFNIPVVTTYKGKGLIPETHPLSLGGHGLSPKSDEIILPVLKEADCVLLVGYDPIEMRIGWRDPFGQDATVIEIAPNLRLHGMHRTDVTLHGNTAPTLALLGAAMQPTPVWQGDTIARAKAALGAGFTPATDIGPKFSPGQVFKTLNDTLPVETVITADSGAHRILLSQTWVSTFPHAFLQSTALCTMGCAVPLAGGYKLAKPDTPVCAFVGDAGLEMGLGELATLRDMKLPIIICVLVDESLALIELKQRSTQRPNVGVDFDGTDFVGVVNAMGGYGIWVDDAATLAEEAGAALTRDTYTVLACRIGRRAYDGTF